MPAPAAASNAASQPVVDLHQVEQRAHHAVDPAQELAPTGALQVAEGPLERLGPGRAAVARLLALVGHPLRRLRPSGRRLQRRPAWRRRRPPGGPSSPRAEVDRAASRSALTAAAAWRCSSAATRSSRAAMSCCSRASARPRGSVRACTLARASSGSSSPSTAGPALAQRRLFLLQPPVPRPRARPAPGRPPSPRARGRSRRPGGPPRPRGWRPRRRRPPHRARPRRRGPAPASTPEVPRARSTSPCTPAQGAGQVLLAVRRQLGRGATRPRHRAPRGPRGARAPLRGRWSGSGPPSRRRADSSASSAPAR